MKPDAVIPHAILLLPNIVHADILDKGICNERPPIAEKWPHESWKVWRPGTMEARRRYPGYFRTLVLAWKGKVNPHGCDWAQEYFYPKTWHKHWFRACVNAFLDPSVITSEYKDLLIKDKKWTIVFLDEIQNEIHTYVMEQNKTKGK